MGRVLDPLLCVFLADIQSVGIGACLHVCVWYTELTCISNVVSKTDIVVGPLPLPGALNHWGRYLPQGTTICIMCASGGATPFAGALNHWGRYLPQGTTICILCASGGPLPLQGALNHWGRYLPPGSYHLHTVCFWRGHSHCRAPLTTGVEFYHRVLPYKIIN